jgi:hypothetical protein
MECGGATCNLQLAVDGGFEKMEKVNY